MIIDRIENLLAYQELLPNLGHALEAVETLKDNWTEGERYPFEGGFVFFQKGETKPLSQSQFEAHRQYIDVQLVLEGEEYMGLSSPEHVAISIPYDEHKDVEKYEGETHHMMKVSAGMGYICFPADIHKAIFHVDEPLAFTKAVIKLKK
ncbi:YhcH/YjgK/YiaL family protein [Streptococcus cameli]